MQFFPSLWWSFESDSAFMVGVFDPSASASLVSRGLAQHCVLESPPPVKWELCSLISLYRADSAVFGRQLPL